MARQYYKRFYMIDFNLGILFISEKVAADEYKNIKQIPFGQILKLELFDKEEEARLAKEITSKTFVFPFNVHTDIQQLRLYASSYKEREMWISAFEYLLASKNQVQSIIKENNNTNQIEKRQSSKKLKIQQNS